MVKESIRRDKEPELASKKDMFYTGLNLVDAEYGDYLENPSKYGDSLYRTTQFKHIYDFLIKHKMIKPKSFKEDSEMKRYIISWFRAIKNQKTNPRAYICNKYKIPQHS